MIGKYFSNGWKISVCFSNDWKNLLRVFQRLEKFFGGERALVGPASGLMAWMGGRRGRARSFSANGMRLEGGLSGTEMEKKKKRGVRWGSEWGGQELQDGQAWWTCREAKSRQD